MIGEGERERGGEGERRGGKEEETRELGQQVSRGTVDLPEVERKERGSWRSANVGWSGRTHARGGERCGGRFARGAVK